MLSASSPRDNNINGSLFPLSTSSSSSSSSIDPYQVLQIRRDATTAEIQQAYKRLALLHHPVRRKGGRHAHHHSPQTMQLFEILAACYETLMDKEARLRCDLLLQDQEKALLQRTLSWKRNKSSGGSRKHGRVVGLFKMSHYSNNNGQVVTGDGVDHNMLGFVGLNTMPSLAEISSCGDGSSMDESFLTQEGDWIHGCVAEAHHVDGQEQVEIVYSLEEYEDGDEVDATRTCLETTLSEYEKDRCASPATADQSTIRPLRILHSQQSSWDDDDDEQQQQDSIPFPDSTEVQTFPSEVQKLSNSNSTDSGNPHEASDADIHYSGAEIDRIFGGPLQLLFRARRWQVFKDPFDVFAEVFGGPLYGDVPQTLTTTTTTPKKNVSNTIRTAFLLPPPIEKLPSEHVSRRVTIHRTRRVALGKEIVRTAVVRIDPRTKQRHVTISVATEELSMADYVDDSQQQQLNSFFQFLDSLCVGRSDDDGSNGTCFFFDFSFCT